jgi:uncharacterized protein YacL
MARRLAVRAIELAVFALLAAAAFHVLPWAIAAAIASLTALVLAVEAYLALALPPAASGTETAARREAVIDTSALIDGRIADVAASGFLDRVVVVPACVLGELHHLADAQDAARRARGRRGLEVLEALRGGTSAAVHVLDDDVPGEREVDAVLVEIALRRGADLITTDFNLNKVAGIRGVTVLNVNDLAHALRPVVLPGESMRVTVVKEGKEAGQGVAYLEDGTMVVIEQARDRLGQRIDVIVTSAIQTAAGKMFFAKPV